MDNAFHPRVPPLIRHTVRHPCPPGFLENIHRSRTSSIPIGTVSALHGRMLDLPLAGDPVCTERSVRQHHHVLRLHFGVDEPCSDRIKYSGLV